MKNTREGYVAIRTAGHPAPTLNVGVGIHQCGHIMDGISLAHSGEGPWIISFKDLEAIYHAAKVRRERGKV